MAANRNSRKESRSRAAGAKTMNDYYRRQSRINKGAKIMALVLIVAMVVFYVLAAGLEIFN